MSQIITSLITILPSTMVILHALIKISLINYNPITNNKTYSHSHNPTLTISKLILSTIIIKTHSGLWLDQVLHFNFDKVIPSN
jgi:hypothetical protein